MLFKHAIQGILVLLFSNMLPVSLCQAAMNSVYIIRNAEALNSNSLSDAGVARASQCLPELFGPSSNYDIGLIMTCTPDPSSSACHTSFSTAQPIAAALGLSVDTSCTAGESSFQHCIKTVISNFAATSDSAVLLIWDENHLSDLRTEFGLRGLSQDQVDVLYTLRNYIYVSETPQSCGVISSVDSHPVPSQTTVSIPALSAPHTVQIPDPTPQIWPMLDLYYTTTFLVPDPTSTPSVMSIIPPDAFTGPGFMKKLKKRQLYSRRSYKIGS